MPAAAGTHECLPRLRVLKPDGSICIAPPPQYVYGGTVEAMAGGRG